MQNSEEITIGTTHPMSMKWIRCYVMLSLRHWIFDFLFSHADVHGRQSQIMRSMQYMQYNKQVIFDVFLNFLRNDINDVIIKWHHWVMIIFRWQKIGRGLFEISEHWNFKKNENYCWGLLSIGLTPWNSWICTVFLPHRYIYMLKYTYFPIHIDKQILRKFEIFKILKSWWCVFDDNTSRR